MRQTIGPCFARSKAFPSGAQRLACVLRAARVADQELLKTREVFLNEQEAEFQNLGEGDAPTCPAYRRQRAEQLRMAFPPGFPGSIRARNPSWVFCSSALPGSEPGLGKAAPLPSSTYFSPCRCAETSHL